jgi:hypothetical protein
MVSVGLTACGDNTSPTGPELEPDPEPSEVEVTVDGTVTNEGDQPIDNVTVTVFRGGQEETLGDATTEGDGTYEIMFTLAEDNTPDELRIAVEAEAFVNDEATVAFGLGISRDFVLEPALREATITGIITQAETGDAIGGASVKGTRGDTGDELFDVTSDAGGVYEATFEVLGRLGGLSVAVKADGFEDEDAMVSFSTSLSKDFALTFAPIEISTIEDLQKIGNDPDFPRDGRYVQSTDIDASVTENWNGGQGFSPIGDETVSFLGEYDGRGFSINNLFINREDLKGVGLFGSLGPGSVVKNLKLFEPDVTGGIATAIISGYNEGRIDQIETIQIKVQGVSTLTGGITGFNLGEISDVRVTGDISGRSNIGGVSGRSVRGRIEFARLDLDIFGTNRIGGVVGVSIDDIIRDSRAEGRIVVNPDRTGDEVGGLAGTLGGSIEGSFADVEISAAESEWVGGLVGSSYGEISTSYAAGRVEGGSGVGGLVGRTINDAVIYESYAVGSVSGDTDVAGLIGVNAGSVNVTYWDIEASDQATGIGRGDAGDTTGLSTAEMQGDAAEENMEGFDFQNVWKVITGGYPALQWEER